MPTTKYIIGTGGVLSGLGKGIAAASIGHLLSSRLKIIPIKCDGCLNVDPGTMNRFEHGEVFVLIAPLVWFCPGQFARKIGLSRGGTLYMSIYRGGVS